MAKNLQQQLEEFATHVITDFERIDGVQFFVTGRTAAGDTVSYDVGRGNLHAREGAVQEWLTITFARANRYGHDNTYVEDGK